MNDFLTLKSSKNYQEYFCHGVTEMTHTFP